MKKYGTHPNLDLDAIASLSALGADWIDIELIPAGADQAPDGLRMVDHPLGEKGILDDDGKQHSAFASLPETADLVDSRLTAEIDEADSTGRVINPRFSLQEIVAALGSWLRDKEPNREDVDRRKYEIMAPIVQALAQSERDKIRAEKEAEQITRITTPAGHTFAVLNGVQATPQLGVTLNEQGCCGAVYRDGLNLGVTRYPGRDEPDLRLLADHLPGWFIHPAGFLACWGSRKSPAETAPPEGTPGDLANIVFLLERVFS